MRDRVRPVLMRTVVWCLLPALMPLAACAHAAACPPEIAMEESARLDPALVRLAQDRPDSVVGVLLRLDAPGDQSVRDDLETAGLSIGTVAGDIVTGRLRACNAARVAALHRVRYIQLAREIPHPSPAPDPPDP